MNKINLSSQIIYLILILGFTMSLFSCNKEDVISCYKCENIVTLDSGFEFPLDYTVCEGDADGQGGTISATDLKEFVQNFEATGGSCEKK